MTGATNRRKGHQAERDVVRYAREHGCPDAVTTRNTGGAGGNQIGDVILAPGVVVEVKNVKAHAWISWCRQAQEGADGRVWAVVRKTPGVTDPGEWPCVISRKWWDLNWSTTWAFPCGHTDRMRGDYAKYLTVHGDDPEYAAVVDDEFVVTRFRRFVDAVRLDR